MINIITKELHFDEELKKKIEFVCGFCNTTPTIINGNIRNIEQTNDTTSNLRDANSINIILKKYEDDLREHSNEVRNLQKKIKTRDDRIDKLEYDLDDANETIDELEDKVSKLQEALSYFKELWRKFIEFLQDKFFSTDKYDNLIQELHEEEIIDDNDLDIIQNEFSSNYSKDDDLER